MGAAGLVGVYKNALRLKKWDDDAVRPVSFTTIDDLKDKRVGVMRGWSRGDGCS